MNKIEQGGNLKQGSRIAMDMTSSKTKSLGGKSIAHVKIDYDTNMLFVSLLKRKSDGVEDGLETIDEIRAKKGKAPDFIRLDRSGENKKLRDAIKRRFPEINIEFTARGTPQQNGRVERAIATIWNRVRAMLDGAGLHGEKRDKLWGEAFYMAVQWWNVTVKNDEEESPYVKWHGELPRWTREPRIFGEMGVARKGGKQSKTENKGFDGMMVGYEEESSVGTFRIFNLET